MSEPKSSRVANPRGERAEQETFLGVPKGTLHGLTCGKRYRFRDDCDECALEAWERMTDGGLLIHDYNVFHLNGQGFSCSTGYR